MTANKLIYKPMEKIILDSYLYAVIRPGIDVTVCKTREMKLSEDEFLNDSIWKLMGTSLIGSIWRADDDELPTADRTKLCNMNLIIVRVR